MRNRIFVALFSLSLTACEEITHVYVHAPAELTGARVYLGGQLHCQMEVVQAGSKLEAVGEVTYSDYWHPITIVIEKRGYRTVIIRTKFEGWGHRNVDVPPRFVVRSAA